eukprot:TRINITY_DN12387_c0_g3_i2.p1 TRINITY_DN12387_c0_g3~~TRINITY_DN12387_c0_g3_i2.p1  ORF type:complete len:1379 (+),score=340.90 TRINITY_DN12387_c0_g3_i2:89-4225(+)
MSSSEKRDAQPTSQEESEEEQDWVTRCICGFTHNDEFMVSCDECDTWQHIDCLEFDPDNVPEKYICDGCRPRPLMVLEAMQRQAKTSQKIYRRERKTARGKSFVFGEALAFDSLAGVDLEYEPIEQSICSDAVAKQLEAQSPLDTLVNVADWHGDIAARPRLERGDIMENRPALFLEQTVVAHTRLIEYTGVIKALEGTGIDRHARPHPFMWFSSRQKLVVDASKTGSVARFVRRSCRPNARVQHVRCDHRHCFVLTALKTIAKGAEVTIAFDIDPDKANFDVMCACGRSDCDINLALRAKLQDEWEQQRREQQALNKQNEQRRRPSAPPTPAIIPEPPPPGTKMTREERKMLAIMEQIRRMEQSNQAASPEPRQPSQAPKRQSSSTDSTPAAKKPKAKPKVIRKPKVTKPPPRSANKRVAKSKQGIADLLDAPLDASSPLNPTRRRSSHNAHWKHKTRLCSHTPIAKHTLAMQAAIDDLLYTGKKGLLRHWQRPLEFKDPLRGVVVRTVTADTHPTSNGNHPVLSAKQKALRFWEEIRPAQPKIKATPPSDSHPPASDTTSQAPAEQTASTTVPSSQSTDTTLAATTAMDASLDTTAAPAQPSAMTAEQKRQSLEGETRVEPASKLPVPTAKRTSSQAAAANQANTTSTAATTAIEPAKTAAKPAPANKKRKMSLAAYLKMRKQSSSSSIPSPTTPTRPDNATRRSSDSKETKTEIKRQSQSEPISGDAAANKPAPADSSARTQLQSKTMGGSSLRTAATVNDKSDQPDKSDKAGKDNTDVSRSNSDRQEKRIQSSSPQHLDNNSDTDGTTVSAATDQGAPKAKDVHSAAAESTSRAADPEIDGTIDRDDSSMRKARNVDSAGTAHTGTTQAERTDAALEFTVPGTSTNTSSTADALKHSNEPELTHDTESQAQVETGESMNALSSGRGDQSAMVESTAMLNKVSSGQNAATPVAVTSSGVDTSTAHPETMKQVGNEASSTLPTPALGSTDQPDAKPKANDGNEAAMPARTQSSLEEPLAASEAKPTLLDELQVTTVPPAKSTDVSTAATHGDSRISSSEPPSRDMATTSVDQQDVSSATFQQAEQRTSPTLNEPTPDRNAQTAVSAPVGGTSSTSTAVDASAEAQSRPNFAVRDASSRPNQQAGPSDTHASPAAAIMDISDDEADPLVEPATRADAHQTAMIDRAASVQVGVGQRSATMDAGSDTSNSPATVAAQPDARPTPTTTITGASTDETTDKSIAVASTTPAAPTTVPPLSSTAKAMVAPQPLGSAVSSQLHQQGQSTSLAPTQNRASPAATPTHPSTTATGLPSKPSPFAVNTLPQTPHKVPETPKAADESHLTETSTDNRGPYAQPRDVHEVDQSNAASEAAKMDSELD